MPFALSGSCSCGKVRFTVESHTPVPYQLCYCSICRKTAGGGGYAINLGALSETLNVEGRDSLSIFRATLGDDVGGCRTSTGERNSCKACGSALWLYDPTWPDLIHPFASAMDVELPVPLSRVHMMLGSKAGWVKPRLGRNDSRYESYPELSLDEWHRRQGLWVA